MIQIGAELNWGDAVVQLFALPPYSKMVVGSNLDPEPLRVLLVPGWVRSGTLIRNSILSRCVCVWSGRGDLATLPGLDSRMACAMQRRRRPEGNY